jgi:hypothetical protein
VELAHKSSDVDSLIMVECYSRPVTDGPDGYLRAVATHVTEFAGQYAQWPTVAWRVDGAAVTARVSWFAGGWAAVSDAVAGVYLSAVGTGVGPDGLSLARLQDGAAYHFDLKQPLRPGVMSASSRSAGAQSEAPSWQRQDWHADQLRLMRESGRFAPPGHDGCSC